MEHIKKTAKVETAYGKTLAEPIEFDYEYDELGEKDEIPAKEMPDEKDLRSFVNQKRNAAARSKAQNTALDAAGIKKPTAEDADFRLKTTADMIQAADKSLSREVAEQRARTVLGM